MPPSPQPSPARGEGEHTEIKKNSLPLVEDPAKLWRGWGRARVGVIYGIFSHLLRDYSRHINSGVAGTEFAVNLIVDMSMRGHSARNLPGGIYALLPVLCVPLLHGNWTLKD